MALHAPHDQQWSSEVEALRFGYYAQPQVDHKFAPQVWEGNQRTTLPAAADGMTGISPRTGPSEGGTAVLVTGVDFARYLNTSYLDSSEVEPRAPPDAASAAAAALALAAGFGAPRELQRCLLGGAEVDPEELHRGQLVVRHTGAEASVAIRSSAQLVCTTSRLGSAGLEGSLSLDFDQAPGAEAEAAAAAAAAAGAGAGVDAPWFCHGLDCPRFEALGKGEGFEIRKYPAAKWASTEVKGIGLDKGMSTGFMRLFNYISVREPPPIPPCSLA